MVFILLALTFYVCAILLGTFASRHLQSALVATITNSISAVVPIVVFMLKERRNATYNKAGIIAAILGGTAIALFSLFLVKSVSINKVGIVYPIVFGGSIFLSTILSYFIFKEKITMTQSIGLLFLGLGFATIIFAKATGR